MHYLEAIDIKPDFYDALYNLGVMYYNKGGDMLREANNIKDFKKYDIAKTNADNTMLKGLPDILKSVMKLIHLIKIYYLF